MGCTILLLALMNLEGGESEREREREKRQKNVKSLQNDSSPAGNSREKTISFFFFFFSFLFSAVAAPVATLAAGARREAPATKPHKQKGNCAATWEPSEGYF